MSGYRLRSDREDLDARLVMALDDFCEAMQRAQVDRDLSTEDIIGFLAEEGYGSLADTYEAYAEDHEIWTAEADT